MTFFKVFEFCFNLFIFYFIIFSLCFSSYVIGGLFISVYSSKISVWFKGIRLSSSMSHNSSGLNFIIIKVKFIIKPLFFLFNFIIVFYLLFRIRLYFFLYIISGFYIKLYVLKSFRKIIFLYNKVCY